MERDANLQAWRDAHRGAVVALANGNDSAALMHALESLAMAFAFAEAVERRLQDLERKGQQP